MEVLSVSSNDRELMIDITAQVEAIVAQNKWGDGAILLFCQHTTCGLTINEGADPNVQSDLMRFFQLIAPNVNKWMHMEGNTDAHIRCSVLGCSLLIPVEGGRLLMGRWQSVFLYEGDGPRERRIICQFLPCAPAKRLS